MTRRATTSGDPSSGAVWSSPSRTSLVRTSPVGQGCRGKVDSCCNSRHELRGSDLGDGKKLPSGAPGDGLETERSSDNRGTKPRAPCPPPLPQPAKRRDP
jgi:hypothetical protein